MGWAYLKREDFETALVQLNKLIDLHPGYFNLDEAHFLRGQCYLKLGYYDFSIAEFEKVVPQNAFNDSTSLQQVRQGLNEKEERTVDLQKELQALEAKLIQTTPLPANRDATPKLPENPEQVKQARTVLVDRIMQEREEFDRLSESISGLRQRLERLEIRKRWEAYAEYGRVKALYLKGIGAE